MMHSHLKGKSGTYSLCSREDWNSGNALQHATFTHILFAYNNNSGESYCQILQKISINILEIIFTLNPAP